MRLKFESAHLAAHAAVALGPSGTPAHRAAAMVVMSALGQKRTFSNVCAMSPLPPKADIAGRQLDVCFVPKADIALAAITATRLFAPQIIPAVLSCSASH
jgi:hypothetical protein